MHSWLAAGKPPLFLKKQKGEKKYRQIWRHFMEMIKKKKEIYCPLPRSIQNTARSTLLSPLRRKAERPVPLSPAA